MSQASFFINLQNIAAYATELFTALDAIMLIELAINSFKDRKQLRDWVGGRWREDVRFATILGIIAVALLYAPRWITSFGREIYVIVLLCYGVQILLHVDYKKLLATKLEKGWYRTSNNICKWLGILSFISVLLFFIGTIAVQDF